VGGPRTTLATGAFRRGRRVLSSNGTHWESMNQSLSVFSRVLRYRMSSSPESLTSTSWSLRCADSNIVGSLSVTLSSWVMRRNSDGPLPCYTEILSQWNDPVMRFVRSSYQVIEARTSAPADVESRDAAVD
jgi:hypothetical protein